MNLTKNALISYLSIPGFAFSCCNFVYLLLTSIKDCSASYTYPKGTWVEVEFYPTEIKAESEDKEIRVGTIFVDSFTPINMGNYIKINDYTYEIEAPEEGIKKHYLKINKESWSKFGILTQATYPNKELIVYNCILNQKPNTNLWVGECT